MKRFSKIGSGLLVVALALFGCTIPPYDPSWVTLIDGEQGLENFNRIGDANWRAEDGAIVADKGGKTSSYLITKNSYRDFQIRAEFWASDDVNSGIFFRITNPKKIGSVSAYEAQINDQTPQNYRTGALANLAPVLPARKPAGKWHTFEITAKGSNLIVVMDGDRIVNTYNSNFASGPFALQWGRGVIKWRKVQVKQL